MIHLFLGVPLFAAGALTPYTARGYGPWNGDINLSGSALADGPIAAAKHMDLRWYGGLDVHGADLDSGTPTFFVTEYRVEAELGPHWVFGHAPLGGFAEFGFGAHAALLLTDGGRIGDGYALGTHAATGVILGQRSVRFVAALRASGAFGDTSNSLNGTVPVSDGNASWYWTPSDIRFLLCAGAEFGGGAPGGGGR